MLDQVGFDHVFDGVAFFANGGRQAVYTHGATVKLVDNGFKQFAVHQVKTVRIDLEHGQRRLGNISRDGAVGLDLGIVAHAAQKAVGNTGGAPGATGDFDRAVGC